LGWQFGDEVTAYLRDFTVVANGADRALFDSLAALLFLLRQLGLPEDVGAVVALVQPEVVRCRENAKPMVDAALKVNIVLAADVQRMFARLFSHFE